MKSQIDSAIAAGTQPKAPRSGLGLVLPTGARFRTLFNKTGLTAVGTYYYDQTGIAPPKKFDYQQDAVRRGASQYITLLDGTTKKSVHGTASTENGSSLRWARLFMQRQLTNTLYYGQSEFN